MTGSLKGYPAESADLEVRVSPYSYNPSAWSQRLPICVLAFIAFLLATHMGLYQWRLIDGVWDPAFGDQSQRVLDSDVAKKMHLWIGVPDAILGAIAYLGDAIFGLAGSTRRWQYRPWLVILFGIDVIPLGLVSGILVICQATIVGNWCFLCLITAVISLVLVVMAYDEVYVSLKYLALVWKKTKSRKIVWRALWGFPEKAADEVALEMIGTISGSVSPNALSK
ncbi:vitamin K epoxide reductase [Blastopirellula sp. J2-11]|uniref:vitamin K epoxide reductase family protein n=1 Tax=Blastopirellula sp. J2-11 TaxID=2943192 RepID=UPI0021CA427B|nr:vitamin K epoxide reductase family protein [Blastopirellula sp. J2-11]UUO04765.1 vitamin K epoxide reductase [Blastopirellula sp. J2-11]